LERAETLELPIRRILVYVAGVWAAYM